MGEGRNCGLARGSSSLNNRVAATGILAGWTERDDLAVARRTEWAEAGEALSQNQARRSISSRARVTSFSFAPPDPLAEVPTQEGHPSSHPHSRTRLSAADNTC